MQQSQLYDIPNFEYHEIAKLVDAHWKTYGKNLRAIVAFGELLTSGDTFDIDLLEVIQGWSGADRVAEFQSTAQLPLRGKLRLYFLETEEFVAPQNIQDAAMRDWVTNLLERVKAGYEIVLQYPGRFVETVLSSNVNVSVSTLTAPASGVLRMPDPLSPPAIPPANSSRKKRR